jgi:predicted N-acyltransferase
LRWIDWVSSKYHVEYLFRSAIRSWASGLIIWLTIESWKWRKLAKETRRDKRAGGVECSELWRIVNLKEKTSWLLVLQTYHDPISTIWQKSYLSRMFYSFLAPNFCILATNSFLCFSKFTTIFINLLHCIWNFVKQMELKPSQVSL